VNSVTLIVSSEFLFLDASRYCINNTCFHRFALDVLNSAESLHTKVRNAAVVVLCAQVMLNDRPRPHEYVEGILDHLIAALPLFDPPFV
jgi:hypothetical protein